MDTKIVIHNSLFNYLLTISDIRSQIFKRGLTECDQPSSKGQSALWQYVLWSFQTGGTKLERFLPKNQHTQRKLLNFENWIRGGLRSFQKS